MHSIAVPAEVSVALDALDAGNAAISGLNFEMLSPTVRLRVLERMEASRRRQIALSHDVIASLCAEEPAAVGGPIHKVIADCLRISCAEARRRAKDAEQLSPRTTLTGQGLPPELPATATVWREGGLDAQHLRVIQAFIRDLPDATPADTVEDAERFLARQATKLRPDQLERAAHRIALHINPDGKFSDSDRARQRAFTWCGQRTDGMSIGKLIASPELRANLDAWLARFAAPGMCNPNVEFPCTTDEPAEEAVSRDARTPGQRQHDALNALVRGQLGDPEARPAQRIAGHRHCVDHAAGAGDGYGPSGDGRRDATAHAGRDPDGQPRLPLLPRKREVPPCRIRRASKSATVSRPISSSCHTRSTRGPVCQGSRLHASGLRCPRLLVRSPPHRRMGRRRLDQCR
jgi:hypothetical protein